MPSPKLVVLFALSLAAPGLAQAPTGEIIVPQFQNFVNQGQSSVTWRSTPFHFQMVYDASLFTSVGITAPMTITRLRFRGDDGELNLGGQVYSGVTVRMSSCPLDQAALSTSFAANTGTDVTTVYTGNVTVGPSLGTVPNNYCIDITLQTPFVYQPSVGLDLCLEVDSPGPPAPNASSLVFFATSQNASELGRRLSTDVPGSPTGVLSTFCLVCLIDYSGSSIYPNPVGARVASYGAGCATSASSFYEVFVNDGFDLANNGLTLTPSGPHNYLVTLGAAPLQPPTTPVLSTADDISVPVSLPFLFHHPGNPAGTTVISPSSNGFVWLSSSTIDFFVPNLTMLHNWPARLCPLWYDWNPGFNLSTHPAAGMYFEIDSSNPADLVALVTWQQVGVSFTVSATGGHSVNTLQCALHQNGVVEFRYGAINAGNDFVRFVGYLRGNVGGVDATDPGSRDLSAEVPFTTTGPDGTRRPLQLTLPLATRPVIGTTVQLTTSNIPATAVLSANVLSFGQLSPGLDLTALGAPGCWQSVVLGPSSTSLLFGQPTASRPFAIPLVNAYLGTPLFSQSMSFDPAANAFGVITSNALALLVGLP